ncbi:chemotaxis protein CheW [Thalassolituus sp. ST750PaO-4]|uniref:chemotaxis protein CheW n=1 Tax=Thalassolituus sp. ST750PaO-4 TaxID=2742965 RepID=UPI001CE38161|nr:chemotaxis protein CheW [Thalassolituus sp. ST750PaO-4]MCA6061950.1 chemotaxis protein CheW [Thalassolituus sp. ST750PaO-4]
MADANSKTDLVNQVDFVLQDYLDQLLVSATEVTPVTTVKSGSASLQVAEPVAETPSVAISEELPSSPAEVKTASRTVNPVRAAFAEVIPQQPMPAFTTETDVETPSDIQDESSSRAHDVNELTNEAMQTLSLNWQSSQGIDCLIFKVAGLKLAIPLPLLGGVHNVTDKVTPLFGQASWSLGVWQGDKAKLTIIDSAQLIMPERRISLNDDGYSFFIQLDRSPWALACQEICDTVTLVHDSIKWRGDGSKRPWLAGTVISEMCALLDVPGLLKLLEENRRVARQA